MYGLQTHRVPRLYLSLTRSWAQTVGGGERKSGEGIWLEWWKNNGARERVREVSLSHQFETDLFFPSKGHQLLTLPHPFILFPPFVLPHSSLPSFARAHCSHCLLPRHMWASDVCVVYLFVQACLQGSSLTISATVYSGGPLLCDPSPTDTNKWLCVCVCVSYPSAGRRLERKEGLTLLLKSFTGKAPASTLDLCVKYIHTQQQRLKLSLFSNMTKLSMNQVNVGLNVISTCISNKSTSLSF